MSKQDDVVYVLMQKDKYGNELNEVFDTMGEAMRMMYYKAERDDDREYYFSVVSRVKDSALEDDKILIEC